MAAAELRETVLGIFNKLLDISHDTQIELDHVHRIPTFRNSAQKTPRDVLCRVHFYKAKEEMMRAAWRKNPVEFNKQEIQVYSDLCRQNKDRRRLLRPLFEPHAV